MSVTTAFPEVTAEMSQVDTALALAAAGIYVFPVDHPELAICAGIGKTHDPFSANHDRGKHPCVLWGEKATVKEQVIYAHWSGGPRNIGIHCGKSGLVVVDEDKLGEFKRYADEHGVKIPRTLVVATAKGRHYYFLAREDRPLGNKEGAFQNYSINIRGGNGYVVGPGSIHQTGVVYRIEVREPPAPIPDWVIAGIQTRPQPEPGNVETYGAGPLSPRGIDAVPDIIRGPRADSGGQRHDVLMRYASSLRARSVPYAEAVTLIKPVWERCEQPPDCLTPMPWGDALAKLNDVYDRYPEGPSAEYRRDRDGHPSRDVGRRDVDVSNVAHAAEWLRDELGRGELAGIFRRDNELVHTPRMGEEGYLPPADLGLADAGPAQVRPIPIIGVKSLIEARYYCRRTITVREGGESTKVETASLFPQQSAQSACEAVRLGEDAPHLKTLRGVTHTPMMRPDGTILNTPGYDAATGFLYLPDHGWSVPPIPDRPTPDEIKAAVELILTPIAEFPFVSEDDRATWIGLLFTPALRPLLRGPYPMGVITATNPGSGKTLLAKMIRTLHGGVQRGEMPRDADELRKAITATLIDTTGSVVTFDNLTGVIRSSVLESLLTSETWTDRYLGHNRSVTATNDRLWLATGNNAAFGGDLARRIVTARLDPLEANPHLRTNFKIDLDTWWPEHRGELLAAILTVARGWVVAGRPSEVTRSDSYGPLAQGLRGMLGWAGFPGAFGGGYSEVAVSSDDEEWHAFLVALHAAFGTEPFTVKELVGELRHSSLGGRIDAAALPGDLAEKWSRIRDGRDEGFRKSLGWWLKNRKGRYASGWALIEAEADAHAKVARYAVKPPGHSDNAGQDAEPASEDRESAGLRGSTGFLTPIAKTENSIYRANGAGHRPGETLKTP